MVTVVRPFLEVCSQLPEEGSSEIPTDKILLQQHNSGQSEFILITTMLLIAICTVQSDINNYL